MRRSHPSSLSLRSFLRQAKRILQAELEPLFHYFSDMNLHEVVSFDPRYVHNHRYYKSSFLFQVVLAKSKLAASPPEVVAVGGK